jgi:hypothetical protein
MSPLVRKYKLTNQQIAQILDDFLEGRGSPAAWDGFTLGMSFDDAEHEKIRLRCLRLGEEFPPANPSEYCNEQGREVIRQYVTQLRSEV